MGDLPGVADRLKEVHLVLKQLTMPQLTSMYTTLDIKKLPKRPVVDHRARVKMELDAMLEAYADDLRYGLFDVRRSKGGKLNQAQLDESDRVVHLARSFRFKSKLQRKLENALYLQAWAQSDENESRTAAEKKFEEKATVMKKFEEKAAVILSGCEKMKSLLEQELARCEQIDDLILRCRMRGAKRDRNSCIDIPFPSTHQYNDILSGMHDAFEKARVKRKEIARDYSDEFNQFVAGCEDYIAAPISMPVIPECPDENDEEVDETEEAPAPKRKKLNVSKRARSNAFIK